VFKGRQEAFWTIKYGSFTRVETAKEFIEGLPPVMQGFSPFVQNMRDVVCNNNPSGAALVPE